MAFQKMLFYLKGTLRIEVRGSSIERFLNLCTQNGISLRQLKRMDFGILQATVSIRDFRTLRRYMGRTGCRVHILHRRGTPFFLHRLQGRYILVSGVLLIAGLAFVVTQFLWGIRLILPQEISSAAVLENLKKAGIHTGIRIAEIDFDAVKEDLLREMDNLSFVAITMTGNRMNVQLFLRSPKPEMLDKNLPTSVIAAKTGIITKIDVFEGTTLKKVGDLVQQGEVLASALMLPNTEQGKPRLVHAAAQVEARTWYTLTFRQALPTVVKQRTGKTHTQYAIVVGKKRINLHFGSSISGRDCDKIVQEYKIVFADHFEVPLSLIRQQSIPYETVPAKIQETVLQNQMEQDALAYLQKQIDGEIISHRVSFQMPEGCAEMTLYAECREQIGQEILDSQELPAPTEGEQSNGGTDTEN